MNEVIKEIPNFKIMETSEYRKFIQMTIILIMKILFQKK